MNARIGLWWALFKASVKMFVRNRAALFFSLFLPLVIMLIFGVLNFEGSTTLTVGIVDEDQTDASAAFIDALGAYEYLDITEGDRDELMESLEEGDLGHVLVIPAGFDPTLGAETGLVAYGSNADPAQAQVAQGLLQQAVAGALAGGSGGAPPGTFAPPVAFESVESRDLGYIDFLVPGIIGMTVMQLGIFGVAFGFALRLATGEVMADVVVREAHTAPSVNADVRDQAAAGAGADPVSERRRSHSEQRRGLLDRVQA